MLPGFEDITDDLTEYELKTLVPAFVDSFKTKVGKEKAITNKQIVEKLRTKKYEVNDVVVRKVISYIRCSGLMPGLVASSVGYYVTRDPKEIQRWIESLDGRETKIRIVKQAAKNYLHALLNNNQTTLNLQ